MIEIIVTGESVRRLDRKEFCKKHQICKRTLERDIKIIKAAKTEIKNLNANNLKSEKTHAGSTIEAKKIFRIIYFYLHIQLFEEVVSEKFCKYFDISQRTLGRDVYYLNNVLEDRQIEANRGVYR